MCISCSKSQIYILEHMIVLKRIYEFINLSFFPPENVFILLLIMSTARRAN